MSETGCKVPRRRHNKKTISPPCEFSGTVGSPLQICRISLTAKTRLVITGVNLRIERYQDEILQPVTIPYESGTELAPTEQGVLPEFGSRDQLEHVLHAKVTNTTTLADLQQMGCNPTAVCEQADDQHVEGVQCCLIVDDCFRSAAA